MSLTPRDPDHSRLTAERLTSDIGLQAELLALNFALEGEGAEQASEALQALSQDLMHADFGERRNQGPGTARES